MCEFCKKIYKNLNEYKDEYPDYMDRYNALIYGRDGKADLYNECDDYYYSGIILYDMVYCPYCGRDITNKE